MAQPDRNIQDKDTAESRLQLLLSNIFGYVARATPAWKISWLQYHSDARLIRIVAQALASGGELTSFIYETGPKVLDLATSIDNPDIYIINDPEKHPIGEEISRRAGHFQWSALFIIFKDMISSYGSVMITAEGKNRFTDEHVRSLLPFKKSLQFILDAVIKRNERMGLDPRQKERIYDKNEFFRQVTLRLCGNLDLEVGVSHCLQYLSRFLPADGLIIAQTEQDLMAERILAESYGFFRPKHESLVPLAEDEYFLGGGREHKEAIIVNEPERYPSAKNYTKLFGDDISFILMPLIHKGARLGIAVLGLEGRKRFREEHLPLFSMLHDPFVLALSNNIKHREIIQLKDLLEAEKKTLQRELEETRSQTIIGSGMGLKNVMEDARLVAGQDSPVLLLGETGVGKEMIANFIHQNSPRKDGPFVKVNCGAIPETLLDSELFGHEKGAFTGAHTRKIGRFERAHGGTIFLDEIGELPLPAQTRLLRVFQSKTIERVGGTETISVDIRIIAATNRNLEEMVAEGKFREDLWFRLSVFPIRIPPLRSRKVDIPALVDHFIKKKSHELDIRRKPLLSVGAINRLIEYDWPGNVRELENVIERELILSKGGQLSFESLLNGRSGSNPIYDDSFDDENFPTLDEVVTRHIKRALALSKGKINGSGGAAELLKIKPNTLRSRMKKLGIPYGWKNR